MPQDCGAPDVLWVLCFCRLDAWLHCYITWLYVCICLNYNALWGLFIVFCKNCSCWLLFASLLPRRCSIESPRHLRHVERLLSRGNVSSYYCNLGSLRDGNEKWGKPPWSLLRSAALLGQSEDSELLAPKQRIIVAGAPSLLAGIG